MPGFPEKRARLLPLARQFALLPNEVKAKYEHPESFYSFGWSHGKEIFNNSPDFAKGSYYNNPQYDEPVKDRELVEKHLPFIHPNIWPDADMPGFSEAFKDCGRLIVQVGELLAEQCDRYVKSKCPGYEDGKLARVIRTSLCCKARLLHYYDLADSQAAVKPDSWCGWHNDHGSLTGLCMGLFLDSAGNKCPPPDPSAGLYIHTRDGKTVKAVLPEDAVGFQIGETAQIHSGGILQATPHCVMGGGKGGASRESFAVFMEPNWDEPMTIPGGFDPAQAKMGSRKELLPVGVPLLEDRWVPDAPFDDFTSRTLKSYY